jgi:outer membrane protein assembly factor BamB
VPGRWRRLRPARFDPALGPEQRAEIARLEALGYAAGSRPAGDRRGVGAHDRARAWAGLNFYTSGHAPEAVLMDMDGRVLHRWRHAFDDVWKDFPQAWVNAGAGFFRRAHLYPNGDLLAIYEGLGLVKLDRDSQLVWASPIQAHHDLEVAPDGDIYVLAREGRVVPEVDPAHPVLVDYVVQLAPDGSEKRRVSILDALRRSPYAQLFDPARTRMGDVFHTNSITLLDGRLAERLPAFRRGNALVSLLVPNALAVVDLERGEVGWALRGRFKSQHDPKPLPDGRLLLFDNRGLDPWRSRVIELDPASGEIAWSYAGSPERPFFSQTCGAVERLPNGNTLVSESDAGRAFELAPDGAIVWEFDNPHRAGEHDELVATLFEMVRLPAAFPIDWAGAAGGEGAAPPRASTPPAGGRALPRAPRAGPRGRARWGAGRAGRPRASAPRGPDAPGRIRSRRGPAPRPPA